MFGRLEALADGRPIAIFPEGTRSRTGHLREGKAGAALIAMRSGAPIVPAAISGTQRIFPSGSRWPRPSRVRIRIGEPLDFSRYADQRGDRFVERAITDEIMYELMALSGREYVDVYASTLKTAA